MFGQTSWKPSHPGAGLAMKVSMSCHFLRAASRSGIIDLDMQVWRVSESVDVMENSMTASSASEGDQSLLVRSPEEHTLVNNFLNESL